MPSTLASSPEIPTLANLLDRLGGVSASRVRYFPIPGTATEQDVIDIEARENRHCELIEGVLVEKPGGYDESFLAGLIITLLNQFVLPRDLGVVTGEGGMMRLLAGLVRIPDVAFVTNERLPGGKLPGKPIPSLYPDLAVEILSESNTAQEMDRKRREYFQAGVHLVWIVDPRKRTVSVYYPSGQVSIATEGQFVDGGGVLPGFSLDVTALFAKLPR